MSYPIIHWQRKVDVVDWIEKMTYIAYYEHLALFIFTLLYIVGKSFYIKHSNEQHEIQLAQRREAVKQMELEQELREAELKKRAERSEVAKDDEQDMPTSEK